jgi:SHS2 domain-containing protein
VIEILNHTADIRVRITATSLPSLFKESLQAMNQILKTENDQGDQASIKKMIEVSSFDSTALLIDFLSEVLTETLISNVLFGAVDFINLEETTLMAQLAGYRIDAFDEDIKAVTYHEADVIENNGTWSTLIVFDI